MPKLSKAQAVKQQELRWLRLCQKKCSAFPQTNPVSYDDERPDFRFEDASLGIEITRYIQDQGKCGSPLHELEIIQERIVKEAQEIFEQARNEQLQVSVGWISNVKPPKADRKNLARGIVQIVTRLVTQGQNCWQPDWTQPNEAALGKHFAKVWVDSLKQDSSFWVCIEAGSLGYDVHRVQVVLGEKESKVAGYRKRCQEIWLVIVAEGRHISSTFFPDKDFETATFRTSFDRVFILDVFRNLVRELRVEKCL